MDEHTQSWLLGLVCGILVTSMFSVFLFKPFEQGKNQEIAHRDAIIDNVRRFGLQLQYEDNGTFTLKSVKLSNQNCTWILQTLIEIYNKIYIPIGTYYLNSPIAIDSIQYSLLGEPK